MYRMSSWYDFLVIEILRTSCSLYPSITEEIALIQSTITDSIRRLTRNQYFVDNTRISLSPEDQWRHVKEEVRRVQ